MLFPKKISWGNAGHLLEEAGEVMRELEAEEERGFAYIVPVHQEAFALFNHEGMDVTDGRASGGFVDYVAQVSW